MIKIHRIESKSKSKNRKINNRGLENMPQNIVIRNDFSCRVSQIKKSNGHSALRSVAYISGRKLANENTGEEHDFAYKKGIIETGFLLPENIKSNINDADFFNHLEKNCHASTNTIAYSSIMSLPKELSVEDQKKLVHEFCQYFTKTYNTAVSFAIHEPDNYAQKKATLKEIKQYNLPADIEKLEKETRNNHVHLVMPYCQIEALTEKDLNAKRKKKNIADGFKLSKQIKDFNPIKYGSEIKKEKPDLLNTKQKFVEFMREEWCDYINNSLEQNNRIERYTHKSYKKLGLDISATKHEGEMVKNRVAQGFEMDIHEYNKQQKAKQLTESDYLNFINRPIPSELAFKILSGDHKAEKDAIEELKKRQPNEMDLLHKLVRDCDDAALLIDHHLEQRRLKQEQEIELAKQQEIDRSYSDFIELQSHYAEFADRFYEIANYAVQRLATLDKNLTKSEKWLSKQNSFYLHGDGLFYDNYHHQQTHVDTPYYFTTKHDIREDKEKLMKRYRLDVVKLSENFDIENTVKELHQNAEILTANKIQLPIPAPTFMQKLKREYIHSFNTLEDFEKDMQPVIDEHRADIDAMEQEQIRAYYADKKREESERKTEAENRRRKAEYDLEVERNIEARYKNERLWANEPKQEKKRDNDKDNDLSM